MGDADITLRHVARKHPEGLLAAFGLPKNARVVGWEDTQLTAAAIERRPDKVLSLRVRGEPRALIVEFEYKLRSTMGKRVHLLEAMLSMDGALGPRFRVTPPISTLVIVLSGRKRALPTRVKHRTGWPELGFSGARYRVEAVYQRTVEELRARGSVLWLVFTPLAKDATAEALREVVNELRERVQDRQELGEMFATMLVLADIDPWRYRLKKELAAMMKHEAVDWYKVSATLRKAFKDGKREGKQEGRLEGKQEGRLEGRQEGRQEGIAEMLRRLFVRRLGRPLADAEQQALTERIKTGDPGEVEDRALTFEGEKLAAWLLDPNAV